MPGYYRAVPPGQKPLAIEAPDNYLRVYGGALPPKNLCCRAPENCCLGQIQGLAKVRPQLADINSIRLPIQDRRMVQAGKSALEVSALVSVRAGGPLIRPNLGDSGKPAAPPRER